MMLPEGIVGRQDITIRVGTRTPEQRRQDLLSGKKKAAQIARKRVLEKLEKESDGHEHELEMLAGSMKIGAGKAVTRGKFAEIGRLMESLQRIDEKLANPDSLLPKKGGEKQENGQSKQKFDDGPQGIFG